MHTVRFGKVVVLHRIGKDTAKKLASPMTRVMYEATSQRAYIINGQEDLSLVDHLLMCRNQFTQGGDNATAQEVNNSLWRFLVKSAYAYKPKMDTATTCQLELLS